MENTTVLAGIDWLIILATLIASMLIGILVKDKAGAGGIDGFFAAGRNLKWWMLGTSIVATQFSADTPLVITGFIAKYGIAGNWFVWNMVIAYVALTVFFARKWRVSGVVTDTEITELRYGGKPATALRATKAFTNAVIINPLILGWVFAAMTKISEPFIDWNFLLGSTTYQFISDFYPSFLMFNSIDNSITIWVLLAFTLIYSAIGGIRAVIVTDLFQFVIAMIMSVVLTWFAVDYVGGLEALWSQLATIYPTGASNLASTSNTPILNHEQISAFVPSFVNNEISSIGIPFSAFVLTLGVIWWANNSVDGSGYIAQRLYTAEDGGQAEKGALWFAFANFVLRSWPWIIAGVAALVIYPQNDVNRVAENFTKCLHNKTSCSVEMEECLENRYQCKIKEYGLLYQTEAYLTVENNENLTSSDTVNEPKKTIVFKADRERSYPALIKDVLPVGLMGLAVAGLITALMSTISTHINWGASYVVNDFYVRFINQKASDKKLTFVSRISTVIIGLYSAYIATFIDNLGDIWILYAGMISGMGLPHLLRWLWWRPNAWTEIVGMLTAVSLSITNYLMGQQGYPEGQMSIFPAFMASHDFHTISWIAIVSCVTCLIATLLTKPVEEEVLMKFVQKIRPMGLWKDHNEGYSSERNFGESIVFWLLGITSIYAGIFGIGYILKVEYIIGGFLITYCVISIVIMVKGMNRIDNNST